MIHYIVLSSVLLFTMLAPTAGIAITSPNSTGYIELRNTGIALDPLPVGYVNMDGGDPAGKYGGTTVLGYWRDDKNQSDVWCYKDAVTLAVQKDGDWRFVLDANYDFVALKAPLRLQNFKANPETVQDNANIYVKGTKLIVQYKEGSAGPVRYKYLDLAGEGTTWVHTTTAP